MELLSVTNHSFIVKIMIEEAADRSSPSSWHGQVTHVQDGEHRYITALDEINDFIRPYLIERGVQFDRQGKLRRAFNRLLYRLTGSS